MNLNRFDRRWGYVGVSAVLALVATIAFAAPALATPVATNDAEYAALGRVFPDPLAGCQNLGTSPCSPNAQGNVPATQFIQIGEFTDALQYMNSKPEWAQYMEVLALDGEVGANGAGEEVPDDALDVGDVPGDTMFPGDTQPLEFDPKPQYKSAGLPTSGLGRTKSDLIAIRVTDESVPDAGKKRYALSLSIHGIERAGVEGGTRAAEDLITAITTDKLDQPVVPDSVKPDAPTFGDVLKHTIIYFTYPNPDGWRRGSVADGGFFFQRYNGNGVDVNRDWPDIGFSFRPYSGLSEPESTGVSNFLTEVQDSTGSQFTAGDDLHGQPFADALSFTLLPHGRHNFEKNERIRTTAIEIHRASEAALLWSPIIQPNDAPPGGGAPCVPTQAAGNACAQIYGQTWGTVYDTINYTTTGALGDWFDSSVGLGADGIDNEMSFSHLDKNIVFDPHTEQLHVDGNKALIYAHLAMMADPVRHVFDPGGTEAYVPNAPVEREPKSYQAGPPPGTVAQTDVSGQLGTLGDDGTVTFPIAVKQGPQPADASADAGKTIFNGGMQVNVVAQNIQGVGTGSSHLELQCQGCDEHPGVDPDADEWVTVAEDYNQSPLYLQSGVTTSINRPQATKPDGSAVEWRAVLSGDILGVVSLPNPGSVVASMDVDYKQGPASTDGATGGDDPPKLAGYDVANTDFFGDLNRFIEDPAKRFGTVDPHAVIDGTQSLDGLGSLVLADDALPGYTGDFAEQAQPSGPPTADFTFDGTVSAPGAGEGLPGTYEEFPFTIGPNDGNGKVTVRIDWDLDANDFDMFLYKVESNGDLTEVASSATAGGASNFEQMSLDNPAAGDYVIHVDNWAAADPRFAGAATFDPPSGGPAATADVGTGDYSVAEKNAWLAALKGYVRGGGNLVLTDGALKALPGLTSIPPSAVRRETVYVGQSTFALSATDGDTTLADPLSRNVAQEGARFNTGERRQTFEPTPLGFSIQNQQSGGDESHSRQYDVERAAWEAAGGRTVATSADSGNRDAAPVYTKVTYGELPLGDGQIRIAGALLPQPTEEFDHPLGLEPYAVTYTGYVLVCNLLDCTVRDASPGSSGGGGTGGGGDTGGGDTGGGGGDTGGGDGGGGTVNAPPLGTPGSLGTCRGETVTLGGSAGADRIRGTKHDDVIRGRAGDDVIRGGRGEDLICAGGGDDRAQGGPGLDEIHGGPGHDRCTGPADKLHSCP
ncbi:MAG: hypothetical protein QOI10_2882 [Solirubrobacterales bacterium]|jgi:hypothetical protein|nr:hypothetical protein [Solirubrobacterales bacterium]